ncbi:MAG: ATP-binding domain-containing protein, partial [Chitinophagaceae bacterium]|nr:ATP-binding domain-containing protein [Chitinophagaceae bacterium]
KRIINYPARGIGKTTVDKLVLVANEQNISMWDVLCNAAMHGFKAGTLSSIDEFVIMIKSFASMLTKQNAYEVAFHVGKQTNLVKELFNDKSTEGVQRYENIQELLNSIKEWTESPDNEDGELVDKGLASYLQQITLLTDADEKDPNADTVKLMTIHAAKGLEFGCVFAAGLEEMLFPNAMAINTREELEEERRLFYVVVTRAKQRLWITYANTRYRFGQLVQNEPSRFIEEIPEDYLDRSFAGGGLKNQSGSKWGGGSGFDRMKGWGNNSNNDVRDAEKKYGPAPGKKPAGSTPSYLAPKTTIAKVIEHTPSADFVASDTSNLQAGQKVEHQKFGFGEVMKMEGAAHNPIATVKFEHNGEKKIMLNYAKLRILE